MQVSVLNHGAFGFANAEVSGSVDELVLMERIADFRKRYPTHPQLDWCERMERRYGPVAEMASIIGNVDVQEGVGGIERLLKTLPLSRLLFGSHFPFFNVE